MSVCYKTLPIISSKNLTTITSSILKKQHISHDKNSHSTGIRTTDLALVEPLPIAGVHQEDDGVYGGEVILPDAASLVMAAQVERGEAHVADGELLGRCGRRRGRLGRGCGWWDESWQKSVPLHFGIRSQDARRIKHEMLR